jgi:dTMP kinase
VIVAVEGLDASGKTTQARLLGDAFTAAGRRVTHLSFPRYETFFGQRIRTLLDGTEPTTANTLDPRSMALWFAMDRWDAVRGLAPTDVLIINRWTLSNAVYQGARAAAMNPSAGDTIFDWVIKLETEVLALPQPTVGVLLDISVDESMKRARDRARDLGETPDVYEAHTELLSESRRLYQRAATAGHGTLINVDGLSPEDVQHAIQEVVLPALDRQHQRPRHGLDPSDSFVRHSIEPE